MDVIWGNEPTTCPEITIDTTDDTPIVEASRRSVRSSPSPDASPSPAAFSDATSESESTNSSYNTGKRVATRARANKLDDVLSAITENLDIQSKAVELKEKSMELQDKRQAKAIELKEKHQVESIERKEKHQAKVIELKEKQLANKQAQMDKLNDTLDKSIAVQEKLASKLKDLMEFMMRDRL
jgi:hypothetical protein